MLSSIPNCSDRLNTFSQFMNHHRRSTALPLAFGAALLATSGNVLAHDNGLYATNTARWATFTQPNCSGCHQMAVKDSLVPQSKRIKSTESSTSVALTGANNRYFWRYRNQNTNSASGVVQSTQSIGSLGNGSNKFDYCAVEVSQSGSGLREWRCGEFTITKNTPPQVSINSTLSVQAGTSASFMVNATDDRGGLQYSASASSSVVTVTGNGPQYTIRGNNAGSATVAFSVTDSDNETTTRNLSVTVTAMNTQPDPQPEPEPEQPPVTESPAGDCVDTSPVGDGWGWNGVESCRVASTGNDQPMAGMCEDTPPVGDGWGWNGVESCRVGGSDNNADNNGNDSSNDDTDATGNSDAECVDTAPVGDGWGWDGSMSCRVDANDGGNDTGGDTGDDTNDDTGNNDDAFCEDTDPVGDGWGWNGSASCRVDDNGGNTGNDNNGDSGDNDAGSDDNNGDSNNGDNNNDVVAADTDKSQEGLWPVCYSHNTYAHTSKWFKQHGESDIYEYCVKKCSSNNNHNSHWGWGWNWHNNEGTDHCLDTDTAEGDLTKITVYAPDRVGFAATLDYSKFHHGDGKWECELETRWNETDTFKYSGTRKLTFEADGTLHSSHEHHHHNSSWSLSGRTLKLHLSYFPEIYRNVVFDNHEGTSYMQLYANTKKRYVCWK